MRMDCFTGVRKLMGRVMSKTKDIIWELIEGEDGYQRYPDTPDPYPDEPIFNQQDQQADNEPPF